MAEDKEKSGKGAATEEPKGKAKKKEREPITQQQIIEVQCELSNVCEEMAFLCIVFEDRPPDVDSGHLHGLCRILKHTHDDTYKVMDLLDKLRFQAVDAEGGKP